MTTRKTGLSLPPRQPGDPADTVFTTQRSEADAPTREDGEGFVQALSNSASDTPMVARVARALDPDAWSLPARDSEWYGGRHQGDWAHRRVLSLKSALAAIAAMREPTFEMWGHAENESMAAEHTLDCGAPDLKASARRDAFSFPTLRIWMAVVAWRAMIDAALAGTKMAQPAKGDDN